MGYSERVVELFPIVHHLQWKVDPCRKGVHILTGRVNTHHSPGAVEVDLFNVIIVGVAPIHAPGAVVQGQAVGPQHVGGDKKAAVGTVHPGFLDPADAVVDLIFFPVRPVHPASAVNKSTISQ